MTNPTVTFTDLSSGNVADWSWNFGDSASLSNTSSLPNPSHTYDSVGTYTVELIIVDSDGCIDTVVQVIEILYERVVYVPNIFAPNNNDPLESNKLFVSGIGVTSLNFIIYDRWGEKVFETTDKTKRWDGRLNGTALPSDSYGYYIEVVLPDGTEQILKGDILLVR